MPLYEAGYPRVTHPSATQSHSLSSEESIQCASFDLHVLGTPPAFILSQDQTLVKSVCIQSRIAWQFCSFLLFLGLLNLSIQPFLKNLLKNFQGCCLLFSYQRSLLFAVVCDSYIRLSHLQASVKTFLFFFFADPFFGTLFFRATA